MSLDVYLTTPATCPHCSGVLGEPVTVYSANITHNLGAMADAAGIYKPVWRPEEVGMTKARQIVPQLRHGIEQMKADPDRFKRHDSANGWGLYINFLPWLERYLAACEAHPTADVSVCR